MATYNPKLPGDIAVVVVFAVLATVSVVLRFVSRHITRTGYEFDDWAVVVALAAYLVLLAGKLWGGIAGESINPKQVALGSIQSFLEVDINAMSLYMATIASTMVITASKLSILHFYKRVFSPNKRLLVAIYTMAGLCVAWYLAATLALIFQCSPIQKAWKPWLPGECFDFPLFIVGIEIPNAVTDFLMVLMPVHVIRSLQLQLRYKVAISMIFLLGALVGVVGLIRIAVVYNPAGIDLPLLGTLTSLQLLLAIFCACLPVFRPLLPKNGTVFAAMRGLGTSVRSLAGNVSRRFGRSTTSSTMNTGEAPSWKRSASHSGYKKYGQEGSDDSVSMVNLSKREIHQSSHRSLDSEGEHGTALPLQGEIMVSREFKVSHAI